MSCHALLSPSGASRWLACTPSARLEEQFPDRSGDAAKEGTLAHALGELLLKKHLGLIGKTAYNTELKNIQANSFYDASMQEYVENYVAYVLEVFETAKSHTSDALLFLERKLDLTDYVPEGFGTGDAIIIANRTLDFIDLKYGKGVSVSAVDNRQLLLYALGALKEFDYLYDIDTVRMTVYQPRLDNVSTWEMSVADLQEWANTVLIPRAKLAFEGGGEYTPGKHCQFCKAKAVCKANAAYHLELTKYDFKAEVLLKDAEISDIMDRADAFKKWLTAVEDHALNEAVNNGKIWPGYKLVEGRSNRQYCDPVVVAEKLIEKGFSEEVIYEKSLIGVTALEKYLGKKNFSATMGELIIKPAGKPTLVPESDKRPAYNSTAAAIADFSEQIS